MGGQARIGGIAAEYSGKHRRVSGFPAATVRAEATHRIQPADRACSRFSYRNVLERRTYRGDIPVILSMRE